MSGENPNPNTEVAVPGPDVPAPLRQVRGVRIAELGRRPAEVFLGAGVLTSIRELIQQAHISDSGDVQVYVNNREIPRNEFDVSGIQDGDNIVAVRKVVAG